MKSALSRWLGRLAEAGARPDDSPDVRLQKAILTFTAVTITLLSTYWVATYWMLGFPVSAVIPFTYQVVSVIGLLYFVRTREVRLFRTSQLVMMVTLPFILQWTLGGFVNSSGVALWAFISPVGALLVLGLDAAGPWFAAFLGLAVVSGFIDRGVAAWAPEIPRGVIAANFVMNIGAVSGVVYLVLRYFAGERQDALDALAHQHRLLQEEQGRAESLLLNVLPKPIADRLKRDPQSIAEGFPEATVLFADVVDFTAASASLTPERVVEWLNELFSILDGLSDRYRLEKIKTIGDAYMAVAGLPTPRADHAECAAEMALAICDEIARRTMPDGRPLRMRIGLHTGPVVAGVIGTRKFIYDLWGDTVNTASRMESHGLAGTIQVTEATYRRLRTTYEFEERGLVPIKGKGEMHTYLLRARRRAGAGAR